MESVDLEQRYLLYVLCEVDRDLVLADGHRARVNHPHGVDVLPVAFPLQQRSLTDAHPDALQRVSTLRRTRRHVRRVRQTVVVAGVVVDGLDGGFAGRGRGRGEVGVGLRRRRLWGARPGQGDIDRRRGNGHDGRDARLADRWRHLLVGVRLGEVEHLTTAENRRIGPGAILDSVHIARTRSTVSARIHPVHVDPVRRMTDPVDPVRAAAPTDPVRSLVSVGACDDITPAVLTPSPAVRPHRPHELDELEEAEPVGGGGDTQRDVVGEGEVGELVTAADAGGDEGDVVALEAHLRQTRIQTVGHRSRAADSGGRTGGMLGADTATS